MNGMARHDLRNRYEAYPGGNGNTVDPKVRLHPPVEQQPLQRPKRSRQEALYGLDGVFEEGKKNVRIYTKCR